MAILQSNLAATVVVLALPSLPGIAVTTALGYHYAGRETYSPCFANYRLAALKLKLQSTGDMHMHVNNYHRRCHRRRRQHEPKSSSSPVALSHRAWMFDSSISSKNEFFSTGTNRSSPSTGYSRTTRSKSCFSANRVTIRQFINHLRKFVSHTAKHTKRRTFLQKISSLLTAAVLSLTFWWATAYPIQSSWATTTAAQSSTYSSSSVSSPSSSAAAAAAAARASPTTAGTSYAKRLTNQRYSEPYSVSHLRRSRNTKLDYRQFIQGNRSRRRVGSYKIYDTKHKAAVQRISLFILCATMVASTYRAAQFRTATGSSKPIRNVTPFGIIRNQSPLGNGVSVIRVSMALGFDRQSTEVDGKDGGDDQDGEDVEDDAMTLLKRLHLEEKELYRKIEMLAMQQRQMNQRQPSPLPLERSTGKSKDAHNVKQQTLANYVSNVASIFLPYQNRIRYGSLDSVRVPFVEDAVNEFRHVAKEDRSRYSNCRKNLIKNEETYQATLKEGRGETSSYIVATILLAIKGDHTTVPFPMMGVLRQRDMARALLRIAIDVKVQDCLITSEVMAVPDMQLISSVGYEKVSGETEKTKHSMSEAEVLRSFPNLIPLT